jgi:hypothetical protein
MAGDLMFNAAKKWWLGFETTRRAIGDLNERIARLASSVTLAEVWMKEFRITRILLSGSEVQRVTGTELDVRRAAAAMAIRTRSCVTVTAVVGHHRPEGN